MSSETKFSVDSITERSVAGRIYTVQELNNLTITNDNSEPLIFPGVTYLALSVPQYGHMLHDIYAQWRMIQSMYDAQIVLTNLSNKGLYYGSGWLPKVIDDFLDLTSYNKDRIIDISRYNYKFERVVAIFDMCNLTPYFRHYLPFCDCYMGTMPCGESPWFKYNEDAVRILRQDLSHLFQPPSDARVYISRSRYNKEYKRHMERGLNLERARLRYFADEQAVEDLFVANDYKVVHAQDYGLYEQVRKFSQASHVASISGAGLLNLMWCGAHTTGIEICAVPRYKWHFDVFARYANVSNYKKVDVIDYHKQTMLKTVSAVLQQ